MEWKEELENWLLDKLGHAETLNDNIEEITKFTEDPMFDGLCTEDKEDMKSNLVFFMKEIL